MSQLKRTEEEARKLPSLETLDCHQAPLRFIFPLSDSAKRLGPSRLLVGPLGPVLLLLAC